MPTCKYHETTPCLQTPPDVPGALRRKSSSKSTIPVSPGLVTCPKTSSMSPGKPQPYAGNGDSFQGPRASNKRELIQSDWSNRGRGILQPSCNKSSARLHRLKPTTGAALRSLAITQIQALHRRCVQVQREVQSKGSSKYDPMTVACQARTAFALCEEHKTYVYRS